MGTKWSKEKVWEWYNERPWIRGCNYMSADCANRIDQWQEYGFEERLETTKRELALAAETGFNSIRIIPEYIVWEKEHDGFMERFERYLDVAAQNGISCMVVLGNDCCPPYEEAQRRMQLGEQKVDWGYHGGRKVSQHGTFDGDFLNKHSAVHLSGKGSCKSPGTAELCGEFFKTYILSAAGKIFYTCRKLADKALFLYP